MARSAVDIRAEIERALGFFPAVFQPALHDPAAADEVRRILAALAEGASPSGSVRAEARGEVVVEHRATADALRVSDERLRLTRQHAPMGMALVSPAGRFLDVNPALCAFLGRSAEDLLGLTMAEVTHPDEVAADLAAMDRLLRDEVPHEEMEQRFCRPDGSVVRGLVRVALARDGGGPRHVVVLILDITERRRDEELLRSMFTESPDLICIADLEGRFLRVSPSWTELLGWSEEELLSRPFEWFVHPQDRSDTAVEYRHVTGNRHGSASFENRYRTRDGAYRWLQWNSVMLPDQGIVVANARDVTEQKRVADELAQSNADLSQFAYVAAHDLKAPLGVITGFADLLLDDPAVAPGSDAHECADHIKRGAAHMQELVDDLLGYARIGTGRAEGRPVDLARVVEEACAALAPDIERTGAEVVIGELPEAVGDAGQLRQLFQNLVGNALKFVAPGVAPRVAVRAESTPSGPVFEVADNGIGIDAHDAERVFNLFSRLHSAGQYPGTGIGLAICRRVVERHGGELWIAPNEPAGTRFRFTLPAAP